jgi:hypothetical protein
MLWSDSLSDRRDAKCERTDLALGFRTALAEVVGVVFFGDDLRLLQ